VLDLVGQALMNLPEKVGVTANLSINYRAPTRADQVASLYIFLGLRTQIYSIDLLQFIVFRIHLLEATGRKARVSATVEDLDGNVLLEAS
jgi:hypothetical protein